MYSLRKTRVFHTKNNTVRGFQIILQLMEEGKAVNIRLQNKLSRKMDRFNVIHIGKCLCYRVKTFNTVVEPYVFKYTIKLFNS